MHTARDLKIAAEVIRELALPLDRLPYTPKFAAAHALLVERLGREIPESAAWLLLLGARKRGLVGPKRRFCRTKSA